MPASLNIPASMASGVTKSGIASSVVPKVVGDVAASGAASLGLGTLLGALGPAYTIYGVLDALGFFDKGMEATPMTPEERELFNAASKVDKAIALAENASIGRIPSEGSEGMDPYVYFLDAYEAVNALSDSELEFSGDTKDSLLSSLASAGITADDVGPLYTDQGTAAEQEIADILGQSGYITSLTGAPGGSTQPTLVEMTQEKINKAASAVGKAQDTLFDIFGIPRPDYSVIQPNAPGGTVIWGQPSGGVFGRIGTTPGGTKVGVQTGIPALDILMGKVADVVSGRAAAGEILSPGTIEDIVVETAGAELGIPGSTASEVYTEAKNAAKKAGVYLDKETGKLGVDLSDGAATLGDDRATTLDDGADAVDVVTGETATLGSDRVTTTSGADAVDLVTGDTATLGTDRVTTLDGGATTLTTDRVSPALTTDRVSPTLTTDRVSPTLTTDRVSPTLTTDRVSPTLTTDRVSPTLTTDRVSPTLTTDRVSPTLTTDRVSPTLTTDRVSPTLTTDRVSPTLTTDRVADFDPTYTERTPTLSTSDRSTTSDRGPGGGSVGGVGLGDQGGIRTVSGAPGPSVDIDYLYDFAKGLEQPFLATEDEEDEKGAQVKKFNAGGTTTSNLPFGLSETQFGLLGATVGGLFGGLGGSGDTQGSQGYTGGIPALTASRELVPGAFGQTYTTPTGEQAPRRPGSAGRRYFTDVEYTPVTDEAGLPTIMGGAELAAMNQAALDRQQELTELGQGLLGLYGQQLATTPTGDTTVTTPTGGTTVTTPTGDTTVTTPTGGTTVTTPTGGTTPTDGTTTTGTTGTPTVDNTYNTFVSQFAGRELTDADAAALASSGYSLNQLATSFGVDPTELRTFVNYYTDGSTTTDDGKVGTTGMGNLLVELGGTRNADGTITDNFGTTYSIQDGAWRPVADTTTTDDTTTTGTTTGTTTTGTTGTTVTDDAVDTLLNTTEQSLVANNGWIDNGDGSLTTPSGRIYDDGVFSDAVTGGGATTTATDDTTTTTTTTATDDTTTTLADVTDYLVDLGFDKKTTLTSTDIDDFITSGFELDTILNTLGVDTDEEKVLAANITNNPFARVDILDDAVDANFNSAALAAQETSKTFSGNPFDALFKPSTTTTDDTTTTDGTTDNTFTLTAADGTTSTVDLGSGADTTQFTGTANADSIYGPAVFDLSTIDPAGGFSEQEQDIVANEIVSGRLGITDVADQFEGVSDTDVIAGLVRRGDLTPAQIADRYEDINETDLVGILLAEDLTTPAEIAAYYNIPETEVRSYARSNLGLDLAGGGYLGYAQGGMAQGQGYYLGGPTDGMADQIPATINNMEPARLSDGEFVIPADVVSHLGNGNSDAGAKNLYSMMERVRKDRTGNPKQGKEINPNKYLA